MDYVRLDQISAVFSRKSVKIRRDVRGPGFRTSLGCSSPEPGISNLQSVPPFSDDHTAAEGVHCFKQEASTGAVDTSQAHTHDDTVTITPQTDDLISFSCAFKSSIE